MTRLKLALGALALLVLIGGVGWFLKVHQISGDGEKPKAQTLRAALAQAFNREPDAIVLNLPPRFGRYPGAVVVKPNGGKDPAANGIDLLVVEGHRPPAASKQAALDVESDAMATASALLGGQAKAFLERFRGGAGVLASVKLEELRIYERQLPELAKDFRAEPLVKRAIAHHQNLDLVVAAYEARPAITLRRGTSVTGELWLSLKQAALDSGGFAAQGDQLVYTATTPVVVAYETLSASFVGTNFGDDVEVKGTPRLVGADAPVPLQIQAFGLRPASDVRYLTIGSAEYDASSEFGNLAPAFGSEEIVQQRLELLGARPAAAPLVGKVTQKAWDETVSQVRARLSTGKKPDLFILYFAGHAVATAAGRQYLVLGDYKGSLKDDLAKRVPTADLVAPTTPGSVAQAVEQQTDLTPPGLVALPALHRALGELQMPFVLIIDGCYQTHDLKHLREVLSFTPFGDYYGEAQVPGEQLSTYGRALREFGQAAYLSDTSPIIFGARPGSVAFPVASPLGAPGTGVAPLAAAWVVLTDEVIGVGESASWGDLLRRFADHGSSGEIRVHGPITWSDFSLLNTIPMVTTKIR